MSAAVQAKLETVLCGRTLVSSILATAYVVGWSVSTVLLHNKSDLDLFFWPAAQVAVSGHPLEIYSASGAAAGPFANGPLGLVPLVAVAAVLNALGVAGDVVVRTIVANAVYSAFLVLMATTAVSIVQRARGAVEWRIAALAAFLLAPTLWISVASFGHFELPIEVWLVLLALIAALGRRPVAAGFAMGLALLTRTTAVLYLVPILLLPLGNRAFQPRARLVGTAAATLAIGIAPFLAADGANVIHSLLAYRGSEPITSGSIWTFAIGQPWQGIIQHGDVYLAVTVASVLCAVIALKSRRHLASWGTACGLLTIAAACFPMLAKTVYPYYFLEPYVFGTVWWLARPGSAMNWRVAAPLLITLAALVSQRGVQLPSLGIGAIEGAASAAAMVAVVVLVAGDILRTLTGSVAHDGGGNHMDQAQEAPAHTAGVAEHSTAGV